MKKQLILNFTLTTAVIVLSICCLRITSTDNIVLADSTKTTHTAISKPDTSKLVNATTASSIVSTTTNATVASASSISTESVISAIIKHKEKSKIKCVNLPKVYKFANLDINTESKEEITAYYNQLDGINFNKNSSSVYFSEWEDSNTKKLLVTYTITGPDALSNVRTLYEIYNLYGCTGSWNTCNSGFYHHDFTNGKITTVLNSNGTSINVGISIDKTKINESYVKVKFKELKR